MMDHNLLLHITTFVFDVDGVFTNSEVLVLENGDLVRTMNTRDGQVVKLAMEAGYNVAIITKGYSEGVRKRFETLGVPYIYDKLKEKETALNDYKSALKLTDAEILYMGDDIPDLPLYDKVGVSACPSDGATDNLQKAMYISSKKGGQGCVREIIEKVMRLQGKWNY
ncbi:MAG: 3-deoxy-D-manno-octulosonate 8-phosphate phosphatase [Saprospiraceae bacterium]|nr:3-deoxy-D-manno-octulosonate 8-phosphate phosphatase [Saprospiraceae bacterium]